MVDEGLPQQSTYEFSNRRDIDVTEIQTLRASVGWSRDTEEVWQGTLEKALTVSSVYSEGKLVGIGFLLGAERHAVLCDICVTPEHQSEGIGTKLVHSLVEAANSQGIKYVTLTYDEKSPWLEDLYRESGFQPISNAMQLIKPEV